MLDAFRILLADAHTCSRIGLYQVLADAGFHVAAEAACLSELDALMPAHRPHLLLLAGNMLPTAPATFLSNLRHEYPETTVVLLLDNENGFPLPELAAIGVSNMVLKSESSNVIVQAVRAAAAGSGAFSPELLDRMTSQPDTPTADAQGVSLTAPEQQLLQLLCAGKSNPGMGAFPISRSNPNQLASINYLIHNRTINPIGEGKYLCYRE